MSGGRKFVTDFIELYKENTCLWKKSDPGYHDKYLRNVAVENLLELLKTKDPNATTEMVMKKIGSIRGSFRKEFRKVKTSEMIATNPEDIHVPKLWYYDLMLFLADQDILRLSNNVRTIFDEMPFEEEEEKISESFNEPPPSPEGSITAASSTSLTYSQPTRTFKRPRANSNEVLDEIIKKIDLPSDTRVYKVRAQHDAFGEHIAEKLRNMSREMVPICQKLINDAIFYADMKCLNMTSHIVTHSARSRATDEVNLLIQEQQLTNSSSIPQIKSELD